MATTSWETEILPAMDQTPYDAIDQPYQASPAQEESSLPLPIQYPEGQVLEGVLPRALASRLITIYFSHVGDRVISQS